MNVVSPQHPFAIHLQQEVLPKICGKLGGPQSQTRSKFNGQSSLFDARWITHCACEILPTHLSANPLLWEGWEEMDRLVQSRWICAIQRLDEPQILEQNYLAVDNEIHLQARIGAIFRWNSQTIAVNFRYCPPEELTHIAGTCAKKSDVYEITSGIFLINADAGAIVYEDGQRVQIFGVARSPRLYTSIEKKCRWMRDYLLLGKPPRCRHNRNQRAEKSPPLSKRST